MRSDLRERYRIERDKRLRPEGNDQYRQPTGRFAHLLSDPYTEVQDRPPVVGEVEALVIGAGFAGLVAAARLRQAGVDDVRLVDSAGGVGGVWYWNRYPGAMCDTAAMVYLPLLEETGTCPSAKYTGAPEILAHARRIAEHFDLLDDALFSTAVTDATWDAPTGRWRVRTDRGDNLAVRYLVVGTGPLHRPKLPGVDGLDGFGGHCFHTSRWDYAYTGGDSSGAPLEGLANKRVGIIGTGATAVQCIPHLAAAAGELYVFQRTPSSVDTRNNHRIDPGWFASLPPGWQAEWCENFATLQTGGFADEDLVRDGWTDIAQRIRDRVVDLVAAGGEFTPGLIREAYEASDDEKMEEIRARVDAIVEDPATAEALKPWYRQLCKRPCFHDTYLQSFNRPTVHLVDTDGRGVERVDANGVWVGDRHYPLDCLVLASGFEVGTPHVRRWGFEVVGAGGVSLSEHWADGMRTLHGMQVHGFPNLFIVGLAQAGNLISNVTHNYVEAATTIAAEVAHARVLGLPVVEPTAEAEQQWLDLIEANPNALLGNIECTPGYYNNEGKPLTAAQRRTMSGYPGGPMAFFAHLGAWRDSGGFDGVAFTTPTAAPVPSTGAEPG